MFGFFKSSNLNTNAVQLAAMGVLSTNIMVADDKYQIVYLNDALISFLQAAERDIQKELPAFNVAKLVGTNIDVFHKNPAHQRGMLERMSGTFKTSVSLGGLVFGLVANPLLNGQGKRIGTVVEWTDSKVLDAAGQVDAINRSQAVIEFNMDGTIIKANENFLSAMGYSLPEIQGKHHSLFVEPTYATSQEYKAFWATLNRGEYQAAEYKRLAKGGREIWIQATYNPIFDLRGKPFKVVKFATDVTSTVQAKQNAAKLIANIAAGSEELSASVREIAESMIKSKETANTAFEQANSADAATQRLSTAAESMGGIVNMISNIASQINLLALNATIESARAGEAGKGFAVVAHEVKNLAAQAKSATEKITEEIDGMRGISDDVVSSLNNIKRSIESVREYVTSTTAAVEEQSAATNEISSGMQRVTAEVNSIV